MLIKRACAFCAINQRQGETRKKLFALDNIPVDGTTIKKHNAFNNLAFFIFRSGSE